MKPKILSWTEVWTVVGLVLDFTGSPQNRTVLLEGGPLSQSQTSQRLQQIALTNLSVFSFIFNSPSPQPDVATIDLFYRIGQCLLATITSDAPP